jgi:hypothetical protein
MKIPKAQSDILLKDYLEYDKWVNSLTEEEEKDEKLILWNTIHIFYHIEKEEFDQKPAKQIKDMYQIIHNILSTIQPIVPTFTFKGVEYGLIPNFDDMTFAELVDLDTDDTLRQICILYRPVKEKKKGKYTIEPYKADIEIYDELKEEITLDIYSGFIGFFLRIQKGFTNYTLKYLMETDIEAKLKKGLEESGVGSLGYLNYVEETLLNRKMYSL